MPDRLPRADAVALTGVGSKGMVGTHVRVRDSAGGSAGGDGARCGRGFGFGLRVLTMALADGGVRCPRVALSGLAWAWLVMPPTSSLRSKARSTVRQDLTMRSSSMPLSRMAKTSLPAILKTPG